MYYTYNIKAKMLGLWVDFFSLFSLQGGVVLVSRDLIYIIFQLSLTRVGKKRLCLVGENFQMSFFEVPSHSALHSYDIHFGGGGGT